MEKHYLIFGRNKRLGRRRIKPFLNDYYKGKIQQVVSKIEVIDQVNFNDLDSINNIIYKLTKNSFILTFDNGGHYSHSRKEIALNLDGTFDLMKKYNIDAMRFFNLYTTLFHEIAHSFQYQYGKDIKRKTLKDYVFFERQAEIISLNIVSQLEQKFNLKLLEDNYIPSYFTEEDILFLKGWHEL